VCADKLSGRERGEENLEKVRAYLATLQESGRPLPFENGRPNISAIADSAGVLRNVFYTNAGIKQLLAEVTGELGDRDDSAHASRMLRQLDTKDRRILQLEQQLANANAEKEELRKLLAAAERDLLRYRVIEEDVIKAGRRVIP
jgi:uncharacterized protein (DUF58 family)